MSKETRQAEKEKERELQKAQQLADMPGRDETTIRSATTSYTIAEELGKGSFGAVYKVKRKDGAEYAMKCESVNVKKLILAHEARVLEGLKLLNSIHFVELVDRGKVPDRFLFVILKLVGKNLWDVRVELPDRRYSLNSALKISEQTLEAIRDMHRVGFLHRDIKPPNFAIGREIDNTLHTIYVLDFGLCRKIVKQGFDLRTPREHCAFRGTTRYASLAAHEGREQSRKDDVEAWWYMSAEMMCGELPWRSEKSCERDKVGDMKKKLREDEGTPIMTMMVKGAGDEMRTILLYLDELNYNSIPDYDYVYAMLVKACQVHGIQEKAPVDWDKKREYNGPRYKKCDDYIGEKKKKKNKKLNKKFFSVSALMK